MNTLNEIHPVVAITLIIAIAHVTTVFIKGFFILFTK